MVSIVDIASLFNEGTTSYRGTRYKNLQEPTKLLNKKGLHLQNHKKYMGC